MRCSVVLTAGWKNANARKVSLKSSEKYLVQHPQQWKWPDPLNLAPVWSRHLATRPDCSEDLFSQRYSSFKDDGKFASKSRRRGVRLWARSSRTWIGKVSPPRNTKVQPVTADWRWPPPGRSRLLAHHRIRGIVRTSSSNNFDKERR